MNTLFKKLLASFLTFTTAGALMLPLTAAAATDSSLNISKVTFSPFLRASIKTKNYFVNITPTFTYTGTEDLTLEDTYFWDINCSLDSWSSRQEFSINSPVTLTDGDSVSPTVTVEFGRSVVNKIRSGTPMLCSFGFTKPSTYSTLSLGYDAGTYSSYNLTLSKAKWIVSGWDF